MDLNLDTLKRSILDELSTSGFGVFYMSFGSLEGQPMVLWDTEQYPDYQMFLDVARKADIKILLFASHEFALSDLDDLAEQFEGCGFTREERREMDSRLRDLRIYDGVTCSLELGFDSNNRLHVYEVQPDWYTEYLEIEEEVMMRLTDGDDVEEDDDSLGGYYSKN